MKEDIVIVTFGIKIMDLLVHGLLEKTSLGQRMLKKAHGHQ